jgi:SAM-dependent methyltransferase
MYWATDRVWHYEAIGKIMKTAVYDIEAQIEETHWWFVGRRRLFAKEIGKLNLPLTAKLLDIGTSTGTNLRMLQELGFQNVQGLDFSDEAIHYCDRKGLGSVRKGDICSMPFETGCFDLVLATDIIEHVDDDAQALKEIERVLSPRGYALITVPTFMSLWGVQDERSQHKRRYRKAELLSRIRLSGLKAVRDYYFNYLLFVPIWLARRIIVLSKIKLDSENEVNSPFINRILSMVFNTDIVTAPKIKPPFGVSCLVIARKRKQ